MAMSLEERQAHRLQYLRAVYDESEGVAGRFLRFHDIGEKLGYDEKHAEEVADYLAGEGLLDWAAMGVITLTHWGLKEVEAALAAPDEPTEHFPALVVAQNYMHVGSISQSQVQQGTTASAQISATASEELRELVADIRAALKDFNLTGEQQQEVETDLATVEIQLDSPRPKTSIVRESLSSARSIFEGALGGGLVSAAPRLPELLERITHALSALS